MSSNLLTKPKWFDNSKYDQIEDLYDFDIAIDRRMSLLPSWGAGDFIMSNMTISDYLDINKRHLIFCVDHIKKQLVNSKIHLEDSHFKVKKHFLIKNMEFFHKDFNRFGCTVRYITPSDIIDYHDQVDALYRNLSSDEKELWDLDDKLNHALRTIEDGNEREETKLQIFAKMRDFEKKGVINYKFSAFSRVCPGMFNFQRHIAIDISAPEKTLIDDLTKTIKDMKESYPLSLRYITNEKLAKWIKYKVLQYVDLKIWFNFKRVKTTDFEIGSILFEDENRDVVSTIRKHTKKYANQVFSAEWAHMIKRQVQTNPHDYV